MKGSPEWTNTEVTFELVYKQDQTFVLFKHAGWAEPVEFMPHCSTKWATFLLSLKQLLETGEGRPAPGARRSASLRRRVIEYLLKKVGRGRGPTARTCALCFPSVF